MYILHSYLVSKQQESGVKHQTLYL